MDSDDEFMDHGSGPESREMSTTPEPQGMAKRTRSKVPETDFKSASGAYAWEDEYQRTWDIVKEDGDGSNSLESLVQQMIEQRKKKIMKHSSTPFQRGIIRTLVVVVDGSSIMLEKDLRPTRFACMLGILQDFVVEFFDQNPIAQMGIVMMRNGVAQVVSEVSGSPQHHVDKIRALKARQHNRYEPKGDPSLQNALELSRSLVGAAAGGSAASAAKSSKEILLIFGALFTSDPGDIHKTISDLAREQIKVKVIGLSAQVAICQEIVARTNFLSSANMRTDASLAQFYGVIMNEAHFKELLMDCVEPLAVTRPSHDKTDKTDETADVESMDAVPLIRMGFPSRYSGSLTSSSATLAANFPQVCACHPTLESTEAKDPVTVQTNAPGPPSAISEVGYICPQCRSRVCSLPTVCPVCGLMLILSTHLARSYHHLVPLVDFTDVPVAPKYNSTHCYGCLLKFPEGSETTAATSATSSRYRCGKCANDFCIDCDVFVHEFLHNCPGCENKV
ncbi:hypothetical protein JCM33374_g1261 [Metschnikowia sp. JCM 33374]|nr:hypothetical protein JCM33374_g1261 [Metschnikowia sp. JCM 33374]